MHLFFAILLCSSISFIALGQSTVYSGESFVIAPQTANTVNSQYTPATFEDYTLATNTYFEQSSAGIPLYATNTDTLISGSYRFNNNLTNWGSMSSWFGITFSNLSDNTTPGGVSNQHNSAAAGGVDNNGNYAVVYDANSGGMSMGPQYAISVDLDANEAPRVISGCYITNNTYALNTINSSGYGGFGGSNGNAADWFKIVAQGIDASGNATSTTEFYLADLRFADNSLDYFVEDWQWFDLSSLGTVASVKFTMESSDVSAYGMNTPAYFCIDNFDSLRLITNSAVADIAGLVGGSLNTDLSNLFTDLEDTTHIITKTIINNTASNVVSASIINNQLSLSYLAVGTSTVIIKGKYLGMSITDTLVVTVTDEEAPILANPIADITVISNAADSVISLENVFTDIDNDDALIIKSVKSNSNDMLVIASVLANDLTLEFTPNTSGMSTIIIEAVSNTKTITDTFTVTVTDQLPTIATPLTDISVRENTADTVISLVNVFTDVDNDDALIVKSVKSNSNDALITASISGDNLTLEYAPNTNGQATIVIEAISNNETVTNSFTVTVTPNTAIKEISAGNIVLFPNPSNGIFRIKLPTTNNLELKIYSKDGKLIYSDNSYTDSNKIDISNQTAGQYFVNIYNGKTLITKSIIIK